jgi:peptidyl-prolyl cis-trans isomerase B (cyclophilin B)
MGILTITTMSAQTEEPKAPEYIITVKQGEKELGKLTLRMWPDVAPKHCAFFDARVKEGYYNGTAFHRVIPGFMIQGGDPNSREMPRESWGTGGYPTKVPAEFSKKNHARGVLSAARTSDPNSFGGQFFICVSDAPHLNGQYTAFGEVVSGMEVADMIVNAPRDGRDNPLEKISMTIVAK